MVPRAPQLLAAVLGRSGCGGELLPLLAEAAAAALRSLSVAARRAHPSASAPFLQVRCSPHAASCLAVLPLSWSQLMPRCIS